jgi:N-acetyltransferase
MPSANAPTPPTLTSHRVQLRSLVAADVPALIAAATDGELWNSPYTVIPSAETAQAYVDFALTECAARNALPFVIVLRETNQVVGSTRFFKIEPKHRKLEIGYTWLAASHQRSFVNTAAKYLLLQYAFEQLNCVRVQFQTDELNSQSRTALLRLGAQLDGIIRNDLIMPNGRKRHSACYSILNNEWPAIKNRLSAQL